MRTYSTQIVVSRAETGIHTGRARECALRREKIPRDAAPRAPRRCRAPTKRRCLSLSLRFHPRVFPFQRALCVYFSQNSTDARFFSQRARTQEQEREALLLLLLLLVSFCQARSERVRALRAALAELNAPLGAGTAFNDSILGVRLESGKESDSETNESSFASRAKVSVSLQTTLDVRIVSQIGYTGNFERPVGLFFFSSTESQKNVRRGRDGRAPATRRDLLAERRSRERRAAAAGLCAPSARLGRVNRLGAPPIFFLLFK